ncbi:molybdenum cofactor synthesis domain containing protein [Nitzschia inconspicua]|uniref:molybdopterin molybdotransferase n=1 Tax=Nitzschia inconspicua TaxID=303405 RepID=A0A9K3LE72_9STRA|nr:molybdenum cofactor synthesis domain containing protein [Nitzschia inconspicua]
MTSPTATDIKTNDYVLQHIPPDIVQQLEAGAFQSLLTHLQQRSDQVQNIDLMTVSGFCRNCLAKWLVVEARNLSDKLSREGSKTLEERELESVKIALDAMGYDEAAQHVYGMDYVEWKKRHASPVSDEKMEKFNASKYIWATHDKDLLLKRAEMATPPPVSISSNNPTPTSEQNTYPLLSNVCCESKNDSSATPYNIQRQQQPKSTTEPVKQSRTRQLPPYNGPALPASLSSFSLGILTVSDRATSGQYETGDLSGPAVENSVRDVLENSGESVKVTHTEKAVVPDDVDAVASQLKEWCGRKVDLILTTGGTGFSPRDVTPEATEKVLDQPSPGLVAFCTMECAKLQPLASLSRGTAGVCGTTLIVNLPGNPKGVQEIIPILLPLALHAVADLKTT